MAETMKGMKDGPDTMQVFYQMTSPAGPKGLFSGFFINKNALSPNKHGRKQL
jgi:hypothetical protein